LGFLGGLGASWVTLIAIFEEPVVDIKWVWSTENNGMRKLLSVPLYIYLCTPTSTIENKIPMYPYISVFCMNNVIIFYTFFISLLNFHVSRPISFNKSLGTKFGIKFKIYTFFITCAHMYKGPC
jgi:hypothetical protein